METRRRQKKLHIITPDGWLFRFFWDGPNRTCNKQLFWACLNPVFFFRLRSRSFIFKNADAQTTQKQQKIFFRLLSVRDAFFPIFWNVSHVQLEPKSAIAGGHYASRQNCWAATRRVEIMEKQSEKFPSLFLALRHLLFLRCAALCVYTLFT